jgi:TetR/AcrR family transcriptional regulator, transcriptional repressor for nem operon
MEALLFGVTADDESVRALGCMGVGVVSEFGAADPELETLRSKVGPRIFRRLTERVREGQTCGEVDSTIDAREVAAFSTDDDAKHSARRPCGWRREDLAHAG